jgi:hypothetical protein
MTQVSPSVHSTLATLIYYNIRPLIGDKPLETKYLFCPSCLYLVIHSDPCGIAVVSDSESLPCELSHLYLECKRHHRRRGQIPTCSRATY